MQYFSCELTFDQTCVTLHTHLSTSAVNGAPSRLPLRHRGVSLSTSPRIPDLSSVCRDSKCGCMQAIPPATATPLSWWLTTFRR